MQSSWIPVHQQVQQNSCQNLETKTITKKKSEMKLECGLQNTDKSSFHSNAQSGSPLIKEETLLSRIGEETYEGLLFMGYDPDIHVELFASLENKILKP